MEPRREVVTQVGFNQIAVVVVIIDATKTRANGPVVVITTIGLQIGSGIQHMQVVRYQVLPTGIHLLVQLPFLRETGQNMERMLANGFIVIGLSHQVLITLGNITLAELACVRGIGQRGIGVGIKVLYDILLLFAQHINQSGSILYLGRKTCDDFQFCTEIQRSFPFMIVDETAIVGLRYGVSRATAIAPLSISKLNRSKRRRAQSLIEKARTSAVAGGRSPVIHIGIAHVTVNR